MTYYAQSDSPITPSETGGGEAPPLVIWGPGDPRPDPADRRLESRHGSVAGSTETSRATTDNLGTG